MFFDELPKARTALPSLIADTLDGKSHLTLRGDETGGET